MVGRLDQARYQQRLGMTNEVASTSRHIRGVVTVLRSLSAFVSLVQVLATGVALRRGSDSELRLDEQLLSAFDVYFDEDATVTAGRPATG